MLQDGTVKIGEWQGGKRTHWLEDEVPLGDDVSAWKNNKITEEEKKCLGLETAI